MLKVSQVDNLKQIYNYQTKIQAPYFFPVDFISWKKSFNNDIDGEGRILFHNLITKAVYDNEELIGFIQYGKTNFGFDNKGEISYNISHNVIRNFYFNNNRIDVAQLLLENAFNYFGVSSKIFAFFHYFGMSCFARHGKLFEQNIEIEQFIKSKGFNIEHENIYYSSILKENNESEVKVIPHELKKGNQQYMDFMLDGNCVGGCEVHFINYNIAYLRWIYINEKLTGKGIGTKCMNALKQFLYMKGYRKLDTDTSTANTAAQHYYKKNGFACKGVTKNFVYEHK